MWNPNRKLLTLVLGVCLCLASSRLAQAETSSEYAKLGQKIYPAFQCAIAAEHMKDREAQGRLFKLGYESGKMFLEAVYAGKVDEKDISSRIPVVFTMSMEGPSVDFMLGRFWELVVADYSGEFFETCPSCLRDDELKERKATTQFRKMNCDFLE